VTAHAAPFFLGGLAWPLFLSTLASQAANAQAPG